MVDKNKGNKPIQAVAPAAVAPVTPAVDEPKTEVELMADMMAAVKSGDYKAVAKVASDLVKFQKVKEQAELTAKQAVLAEKTERVKSIIAAALKPLIDSKFLDAADGVWYTNDFGEKLVAVRLLKSQPKAGGSHTGGGGGKKFSVSTTELLEKFGAEEYKGNQSFKVAYESNTDKNWRYAIREALLKKNGNIQ